MLTQGPVTYDALYVSCRHEGPHRGLSDSM